MGSTEPVLEVTDLEKYFSPNTNVIQSLLRRNPAPIKAVDGVSLTLDRQEVKGIIGESGCGKTTLLRTLMGLYDKTGGNMRFQGEELTADKIRWKDFRRKVQIIFQDPFNSLNPRMTVEETLREPLEIHGIGDRDRRVREVLERVELPDPERYLHRRPAQLSGGEMQRVSIARALITDPEVILADEPVSMLDVSTQAAILKLLARLIEDYDVSMLYISHDLSTVSYICDEINVMYLGRIVESAPTEELLEDPKHPYSKELIGAVPIPNPYHDRAWTQLDGSTPDPKNLEGGCRFKDRCPERMDICDETPISYGLEEDRSVACHLYYDHEEYLDTVERKGDAK